MESKTVVIVLLFCVLIWRTIYIKDYRCSAGDSCTITTALSYTVLKAEKYWSLLQKTKYNVEIISTAYKGILCLVMYFDVINSVVMIFVNVSARL